LDLELETRCVAAALAQSIRVVQAGARGGGRLRAHSGPPLLRPLRSPETDAISVSVQSPKTRQLVFRILPQHPFGGVRSLSHPLPDVGGIHEPDALRLGAVVV